MTRVELAQVLAYIGAAVGKEPTADQAEVYLDLLGDLPIEVVRMGAKLVVLEHKWPTFPMAAEIRRAAIEAATGGLGELTPAEAWATGWQAVARMDPEIEGSVARACEGLPPLVIEALQSMGICALCYGKEPVGVIRSQFLKIYEQLQARTQRQRLLPESLKREIEALPAAPLRLVSGIGDMPEENGP